MKILKNFIWPHQSPPPKGFVTGNHFPPFEPVFGTRAVQKFEKSSDIPEYTTWV